MNSIIDKLIQRDKENGYGATRGLRLGRTAVAGTVLAAGLAGGFTAEGKKVVDTGVGLVRDIATSTYNGTPKPDSSPDWTKSDSIQGAQNATPTGDIAPGQSIDEAAKAAQPQQESATNDGVTH